MSVRPARNGWMSLSLCAQNRSSSTRMFNFLKNASFMNFVTPAGRESLLAPPAQALLLETGSQLGGGFMYDVLVVGGGNAALCSAISARRAGAKVLVVEVASKFYTLRPTPCLARIRRKNSLTIASASRTE